jgi:D-sedoheptulose 7-phosphate isomerase
MNDHNLYFKDFVNNHNEVILSLLDIENKILQSSKIIFQGLKKGGKLLFCGNGGSAADAQHLAAEMLIRLRPKVNRTPIPALSLALDSSTMTACANDYSFNYLFSRNLRALYKKNDILVVISTSGNSPNIINVLKEAKKLGIFTIGFLGSKGGHAKKYCKLPLIVNSNNVARIQEAHIFLGHFILQQVENMIIKK